MHFEKKFSKDFELLEGGHGFFYTAKTPFPFRENTGIFL